MFWIIVCVAAFCLIIYPFTKRYDENTKKMLQFFKSDKHGNISSIKPKNGKKIPRKQLVIITNKLMSLQKLNNDEQKIVNEYGRNDYNNSLINARELKHATLYTSSNGMPHSGKLYIRQDKDNLVYFSEFYQEKPSKLYKLVKYEWNGPRYETSYTTTGTSKNKHLVPIINQKRTSTSRTRAKTTEHATLGKLTLVNVRTNNHIVSEGMINTQQNSVISAFKLWRDAPNQALTSKRVSSAPNTSLDDLTKLKSLLDKGVITQSDFDAKKKQILGL